MTQVKKWDNSQANCPVDDRKNYDRKNKEQIHRTIISSAKTQDGPPAPG